MPLSKIDFGENLSRCTTCKRKRKRRKKRKRKRKRRYTTTILNLAIFSSADRSKIVLGKGYYATVLGRGRGRGGRGRGRESALLQY